MENRAALATPPVRSNLLRRSDMASIASDSVPTKYCPACTQYKPVTDFGKNASSKDGRVTYCKPCLKGRRRVAYAADAKAREAARFAHKLRAYGMSREAYERLEGEQWGRCAICGELPSTTHGLCVDHDHEMGKVRGLLCNNCNAGLGYFGDSADVLRAAAAYLDLAAMTMQKPGKRLQVVMSLPK